MKNEIIDEIFKISSKVSGIDKNKLSRKTKISKDLQIYGDDVSDILNHLYKKYNINFDGFIFDKYFESEAGFYEIQRLFNKYFFKSKYIKPSKYQITLGDLEKWVMRGYWVDPD